MLVLVACFREKGHEFHHHIRKRRSLIDHGPGLSRAAAAAAMAAAHAIIACRLVFATSPSARKRPNEKMPIYFGITTAPSHMAL